MLTRSGLDYNEVDEIIKDIIPEIIPFTEDVAIGAGKLVKLTREFGLSFGDRACTATGIHYGMPIYTADKVWKNPIILANIIIVR